LTNSIEIDRAGLMVVIERLHAERFNNSEARDTFLRLVGGVCQLQPSINRSVPMGQIIEGSTSEFIWVARYDLEGRLVDVDVRRHQPTALRVVKV
jgi:hypothetical protein